MIHIKKIPTPQHIQSNINEVKTSFTLDGTAPNKRYRAAFDLLNKDLIRESLFHEQHGLCGYCMSKITTDRNDCVIEHVVPLSKDREKALDYQNYILSCTGGKKIGNDKTGRTLCCDAKRENLDLQYAIPTNYHAIEQIKYRYDGIIYSDDPNIDLELNHVLGLNGSVDENNEHVFDTLTNLVQRRRNVFRNNQTFLQQLFIEGKLTEDILKKRIRDLLSKEQYDEFLGEILFVLNNTLNQLKNKSKE